MKIALAGIALAALLAPTTTAQTDPLGNWIVRPYGFQAPEHLLTTQVRALEDTLQITVSGGQANGPVAILFGVQPTNVALNEPFAGQLWVAPTAFITQQLNGSGAASLQFDLAATGLDRFYVQVAAAGTASQLLLSRGHELHLFQTGNITYLGPQLSARINVLESAPVRYELEVQVAVPTLGWHLTHDSTTNVNGVEEARFTLQSPAEPPVSAAPPPLSVRVDLGTEPGYAAKILVSQTRAGVLYFVQPPYNCAAMINIYRAY